MAVETQSPQHAGTLDGERLQDALRLMLTIRIFDERALALYRAGEMRGTTHPYIGMEAVGVGVMMALRPDDYVTSTHRGHGHTIAKGGDPKKMMAELLGRATGYSGGKGGSMHIADMDKHMLGANGIVGGGMGLATGAALTAHLQKTGSVAICFFGDGALEQGILHETTNLAAIWKLPVLYVCENNQYAMSARSDWSVAGGDPAKRAAGYGIPGVKVDGMDLFAVNSAASELIERARRGEGPAYLICNTYRFHGHHAGDPLNYREREEVERWRQQDPIERVKRAVVERGVMRQEDVDALEQRITSEIEEAVEFAKNSPEPTPDQLMTDIYA
ncbi:MAG: thiamine pyrophosphate-dependent dehydrogenase E1 component subunit alpha [Chloroflexi bacterium]|nr:thiamine pyrophosphate-dependent dehydrogenase E1 component subunit alpha [Chloroflexota bacterium]MBV9545893.1 thiamine pyrophosphate-dependent dehydrogenase E1 component subunit alpha [Chloroflexota bacterium]